MTLNQVNFDVQCGEIRALIGPDDAGKTAMPNCISGFYRPWAGTYTGKRMMEKQQLERVRRFCLAHPETSERLSHGEPTFFVKKKVFVMFADNHHSDGHIAVWLPVPAGLQSELIEARPETFFRPPYVGGRGWVGMELDRISDDDLEFHIQTAWELIAPKRLVAQ
ncbi:MAG: MmcQ/YjbR family DNA-binding protein, partial [Caldilineaceae bacterium]